MSVAGKERKGPGRNRAKQDSPFFMDFPAIPKAGKGARSLGKEGKEERKEEKGLPQALTASSAPISGEHEYGRP